MPARMARIVMTSSSSTSVNAPWGRRSVRFVVWCVILINVPFLFDVVLHGKDRVDHSDKNRSNKRGDEKKHDRLQKRHRCFQVPVQVSFRHRGDADQFLVQLAAL